MSADAQVRKNLALALARMDRRAGVLRPRPKP